MVEEGIQYAGEAEECHTHTPYVPLRGVSSNYGTDRGNNVGNLQCDVSGNCIHREVSRCAHVDKVVILVFPWD